MIGVCVGTLVGMDGLKLHQNMQQIVSVLVVSSLRGPRIRLT